MNTSPSLSSGVMHCWLMAKVEICGKTYVSLRGVNWQGEFDKSRPYMAQGAPWWHVPTCKFNYDATGKIPDALETLNTLKPILDQEWPGIAGGRIYAVDQEITGEMGKYDHNGNIEPVTRIAIDLGKQDSLPLVMLRPTETLSYPRHPVVWMDADDIKTFDIENETHDYIVEGNHNVTVETKENPKQVIATNLRFQASVGDMFVKSFGDIFAQCSYDKNTRPAASLISVNPG